MTRIASVTTLVVQLPTRREHKWTGLTEPIGRYILTRLDHSGASKRLSKEEVLKAINGWNTKMNISWEQLRQLTREV